MTVDAQGWLSDAEITELQRLAKGVDVLEAGCWKARSTISLARTARSVISIDHFCGDQWTGNAHTFPEAVQNIQTSGLSDKITLIVGGILSVLPRLQLFGFGLFHYDASHDYATTYSACKTFLNATNECGTLAIHDYDNNENHKEVREVVKQLQVEYRLSLAVVDRLAVLSTNLRSLRSD